MNQVLVTGGAGYVGAVLVPRLLEEGYRVNVLDWFLFGEHVLEKHPHLAQMKGDIRDDQLVAYSLRGCDAVIHLASISNDPSYELNPALGKSINYDATCRLVDSAKQSGVKRFVFASSSSVYGVKAEPEVTEELLLEPLTDYSRYKAEAEKYILAVGNSDFTVLILRPATVCGWSPRMRLDLTVNLLTIQALTKGKMTVYGGSQKRPNIHIQDMAEAYNLSLKLDKNDIAGKTYNVGYENYTIMEIAQMIQRVLGDPAVEIVSTDARDKRSYSVSSKKIQRELGFTADHGIEDAISDIKNAYAAGKIPNANSDSRYYNIRVMKERAVQ